MTGLFRRAAVLGLLVLAGGPGAALAQDFGGAFGGLSASSDTPIQIEADRLEVHDDEKYAVYKGNVSVIQGETVLKTAELKVFYISEETGGKGADAPAAKPGKGAGIDRIEALGGVIVKTPEQTATGESATFEMASETVTLAGNVVLTQGENILKGDRLLVNLKTKQARIVGGAKGGRVQTILTPGSAPRN